VTRQLDLGAIERTALLTAALRARETGRADRLFEDPYAAALAGDLGPALLAEVLAATFPATGPRTVPITPDYNSIRTRFFDDVLQRAVADGTVDQVVLAPAGMDSRAYRLDWPDHIRYFEIDRPTVLRYKRERLAGVRPRVDHRVVPVDLVHDDWEQALREAGYDPDRPSIWLFEGLLYYIPGADTHRMLDRAAAFMAPGSLVAADIPSAECLTDPRMRPLLDVFAGWGCPFRFGSDDPEELFARHGFTVRTVHPGTAETAAYRRWVDPVPAPDRDDVQRLFYVHGNRR
jgi:methyltransferase (TIGR00027 family)